MGRSELSNSRVMTDASKYLNSPRWVQHMKESFKHGDWNGNGYIELADWDIYVDNIQREVQAEASLVATLRSAVRNYCAGFGLTSGKRLTCDEFVNNFANFAVREVARKSRGEEPLLSKMNDAWYDVVDSTRRDGFVTLDEYRKAMKACNISESVADQAFALIDKNNDGKIQKSELNEYEFGLWFVPENFS